MQEWNYELFENDFDKIEFLREIDTISVQDSWIRNPRILRCYVSMGDVSDWGFGGAGFSLSSAAGIAVYRRKSSLPRVVAGTTAYT